MNSSAVTTLHTPYVPTCTRGGVRQIFPPVARSDRTPGATDQYGSREAGRQRRPIIPRSAPLHAVEHASWPAHLARAKPLVWQEIKPVQERVSHAFRVGRARYGRRLAEQGLSHHNNVLRVAVKILGF